MTATTVLLSRLRQETQQPASYDPRAVV